jgi:hypothetical protein
MEAEIEKDGRAFVARVTFESGAVWSFTDGGVSRSLEAFLPKAQAWFREVGCHSEPRLRAAEAAE